jgi:hypothetical protein
MAKRTPKPAGQTPGGQARSRAVSRKPAASPRVRSSPAAAKATAGTVYQVKITLDGIRPPIWRRVQVKDCTLARLHDIIQVSMGWDDYHLHEFEITGERFGDPEQWDEPDPWGEQDVANERKVKLSQLLDRDVKKFRYAYDMGDDWQHTIQIEKVLPAEAGVRYPRCIDGKRACPPEDCRGPWGYADLLEALQKPKTPRQEELLEWIGGEFDAEAFDPEAVNQALTALR